MIALVQKLMAAETLQTLEHLEAKTHLSHDELHKRDACIARLVRIGAPAVPMLVKRLSKIDDNDPTASVPNILRQIGDAAVPCLAKARHDGDCNLRHNAIAMLGHIGTPAALRELEDETVDLIDKETVEAALHEARHHHSSPTL